MVCAAATCAVAPGCRRDAGPELQILGESARIRVDDAVPRASPWFDGTRVTLVAARGETLGIQVWHRGGGPVSLAISGARVQGFAVTAVGVVRPSTGMYGGSHGAGAYPDVLTPAVGPATDPAYFEIMADGAVGAHDGELTIGARRVPVMLAIAPVELKPTLRVWAYEDPRELGWAGLGDSRLDAPSAAERACIAMFHERGVMLSPDLPIEAWPARKELLVGFPFVPAVIPDEPAKEEEPVRAWIAATQGTDQVPFAIPIDEPHTPEARARVSALAGAVHAAGGGPGKFLYAVTADRDDRSPVDLYITLHAKLIDPETRWTYNGAPPLAGSMVADAESPGARTWGWIGWRWKIPIWYVWDALYWHDRHNRKGAPLPGRALDARRDAVSFDDGDDHGNLDGVLALPGDATTPCLPTLRLEALRRGVEDRALLELAAACAPDATAKLAERMVPRALGDAGPAPAWPSDEAAWEQARRELIQLASCGK